MVAREEFGLAGTVQHGVSTLPDEAFDMFPTSNTAEIHLPTGFQNIIFDSRYFPKDLLSGIYKYVRENHCVERVSGETDEQFYYKTRKRTFAPSRNSSGAYRKRPSMESWASSKSAFLCCSTS